jgi:hypothetical protein
MGDELGCVGARPLPGRQSVGTAGAEIRLPGAGSRRARPDLPPDRVAGCLGQAGAAALLQRDGHQTGDVRRRLCRTAARQRHGRGRHQPAGALRRQAGHHGRARQGRLERRDRAAVREGRQGARGTQARGQLPRRGRNRPNDLARQGAADLLCDSARRGCEGTGRGRSRVPVLDRLVVLPRRGGHDGPRRYQGDRRVRRLDHRRHAASPRPDIAPPSSMRASAETRSSARRNIRRRSRSRAARRR